MGRNRAEGWTHAKFSGHENEELINEKLQNNTDLQLSFLQKIGENNSKIISCNIGGLGEKDVDCVFPGEKTKSKTDMHITLSNGNKYNISIKKSLGGQVYLISDKRFIEGFEAQYKTSIPENVKRGIHLFWGSATDTLEIIESLGTRKKYELHKNRLVADSIKIYDQLLYENLLNWFKENICEVADFCFSKGLAKNNADWADYVWYKNELEENPIDDVFFIPDLCKGLKAMAQEATKYGPRNGGTTICLPFGFVQWHQSQMQFHHDHAKVKPLMK